MKYVFFGTPDRAVIVLQEMKESGFLPELIVTAPDKPVGRKQIITSSEVKRFAIDHNIPVVSPESKTELLALRPTLENLKPEFLLSVAYGYLIPNQILSIASVESINIHYSLLPKWRGASPVVQQVLHGDSIIGWSVMRMVAELDAGAVFYQKSYPIPDPLPTTGELALKMSHEAGQALPTILQQIQDGKLSALDQDPNLVTTCSKLSKSDGELNFAKPDIELYRTIKAMDPWPLTFFNVDKGNQKIRVKVNKADWINNKLVIQSVTPAGKKPMSWSEFVNWIGFNPIDSTVVN